MNPAFFDHTGLGWGTGSLCTLTVLNHSLAEERAQYYLDNWITEADFKEIAYLGYNSVRLPIGYWNVIQDDNNLFAPQNVSVSLKYIDNAFSWAEKYGLTVLIDLHGAPGSQNGMIVDSVSPSSAYNLFHRYRSLRVCL